MYLLFHYKEYSDPIGQEQSHKLVDHGLSWPFFTDYDIWFCLQFLAQFISRPVYKSETCKGQHQSMTEILYLYSVKIDGGRGSADIVL